MKPWYVWDWDRLDASSTASRRLTLDADADNWMFAEEP